MNQDLDIYYNVEDSFIDTATCRIHVIFHVHLNSSEFEKFGFNRFVEFGTNISRPALACSTPIGKDGKPMMLERKNFLFEYKQLNGFRVNAGDLLSYTNSFDLFEFYSFVLR